jgi:hypothetical protein
MKSLEIVGEIKLDDAVSEFGTFSKYFLENLIYLTLNTMM